MTSAGVKVGRIHVELDAADVQAAVEMACSSFTTILDALCASRDLRELAAEELPDLFRAEGFDATLELIVDPADLIRIEVTDRAAGGANQIGLIVQPNERYLELVAAITRDGHVAASFDAHGWPPLRLIESDSTADATQAGAQP
jgi:hypothetical protein